MNMEITMSMSYVKILLRNLTGSSAFRNGGANHEISE